MAPRVQLVSTLPVFWVSIRTLSPRNLNSYSTKLTKVRPMHICKGLLFGLICIVWYTSLPTISKVPNHKTAPILYISVQFSHSVVSDSLWPHGLQHARLSCPSSVPRVYSNSCILSQWCHPTISSTIISFSSHPQSFPASGSFQMSQFFTSGGQSVEVFSFSISSSKEYSGLISFRMDWLDLLAIQGTLKSLLQHHSSKASIPWRSALFILQVPHPYMTTGKIIALTRQTSVGKVMSLLFNMLSRLAITFFQGAGIF